MTRIDDTSFDNSALPPGYWFSEINARLRERMRDELRTSGLRRGGWRILHLLADGPATPAELAERLPRRRRESGRESGREQDRRYDSAGHPEHLYHGQGHRPGDHLPPHHNHDGHHNQDHPHDGERHHIRDPRRAESAYERGFERGFLRGFGSGHGFGGVSRGGFPGRSEFEHGFRHGRPGCPFAQPWRNRRDGLIERVLAEFVERGWVWFDDDQATLTDEGRDAHDAAYERVRTVRETVGDGISAEDYATTMATLEKMAANLGWTPAARS